jgi:arginase
VIDKMTGKSFEIQAPDGKFSIDVSGGDSAAEKIVMRSHILNQRVQFIGAPFAEGQNLRGCEIAPMAVRKAGLKDLVERMGWEYVDNGDLQLPSGLVPVSSGLSPEWQKETGQKYAEWIRSGSTETFAAWSGKTIRTEVHVQPEFSGCPYETMRTEQNIELTGRAMGLVHNAVRDASARGDFALTIGGDHSIASATIGGLLETYPNLAVIWVDAHADANTPSTSPSLHYHGMPAAHVMGWFSKPLPGFEWLKSKLPENRLAYIGLRDVDMEEGKALQTSGVHIFTMHDVDRHGISQVIAMAMSKIDPYNNRPVHLTFDIDGIDPAAAPGTGTLARGGLNYRESHFICEELASSNRLVGLDLVEVNPLVDALPEKMHGDDPTMGPASCTVQLCCELALSALGKTIIQRPEGQAAAHIAR